jgi:hypothetical protein
MPATTGARMRAKREMATWRCVAISLSSAGTSAPADEKPPISPPAQNILPVAVISTARTAGSSSHWVAAAIRSLAI